MDDIGRQLAELTRLWNKNERRLKEAEQFRGEAVAAAINEMRYAGRRLADVLYLKECVPGTPDRDAQILEHLIVAKTYLVNADHDITDAICFVVHRHISRLVRRFGTRKIGRLCPEFEIFYPRVKDAPR